jgi:hypothetical protein
MTVLIWEEPVELINVEQTILLPPLLELLRRRRWISASTRVRTEFAWNGRRVDLATITSTGRTAAYELKIGSFGRVLEQAMYNRLSFERSWVVVSSVPRPANLAEAAEHGVGVIVLRPDAQILIPAASQLILPVVRARLRRQLLGGER